MALKQTILAVLSLLFLPWISSCCHQTESYKRQYAHLDYHFDNPINISEVSEVKGPFIIFFVDARHLDYENCSSLARTIAKHPDNLGKGRDVGHAWIYLEGEINGQKLFVEGGHSGELGITQAKYFDGVMNYLDYGYANPTKEEMHHPCDELNPIKYLWEDLDDGFFQIGAGNHRPTFAARVNLNQEQFNRIFNYIMNCYNFNTYSLTGTQCSSFVAQIAALANLHLESEVTMKIEPQINFNGINMVLWKDPAYQYLTFSTPDILEKSLIKAVQEGKAKYIPNLRSYKTNGKKTTLFNNS